MTTTVDKCPTCGGDVIARHGEESDDGMDCTMYYEPVGSAEEEQKVAAVARAINRYHLALDRREHGGIAQANAILEIQEILGLPWEQGKMLKELEQHPGMRQIYG